MVRPEQLLHPQRQSVSPRPAATMLLLRDAQYEGSPAIEVLMTRRSAQASFAPGAFVFPGGAIDSSDAGIAAGASRRSTQNEAQLVAAVAAIRETFEELGVLLARQSDGAFVDDSDIATLDRRAAIEEHHTRRGLTLAADCVYPLAHWITDRDLPRRFDVQFFVARSLKAHRLAREAKIAQAVKTLPNGSIDDWLRHAYDDVPERLWPAAARSLLAHLERLDEQPHAHPN
ncbi:NUDIX domain-containing protein [Paraburkholderia sp. CNPSo 3274]|uniref:NUDIX domain-containing protein n=1 Tax=Paraburkholderia sp. CNPSo 3274 TaxID=2940932 RepID=UPI0035CD117C